MTPAIDIRQLTQAPVPWYRSALMIRAAALWLHFVEVERPEVAGQRPSDGSFTISLQSRVGQSF